MTDDAYLNRFSGIGRLYGVAGLEKFRRAHVAVVGIGGVGCWAAECLARSGIGKAMKNGAAIMTSHAMMRASSFISRAVRSTNGAIQKSGYNDE